MGADMFDTDAQKHKDRANNKPRLGIGNNSYIEGAIIDKNVRIGNGVRIVNEQAVENRGEDEACIIRDGIPCVVKDGVIPDNYRL